MKEKIYKYLSFGNFISISMLIIGLLAPFGVFIYNSIYVLKTANREMYLMFLVSVIITASLGIFFWHFICPHIMIINEDYLYIKSLIGVGHKIKWENISEFVRKFSYRPFTMSLDLGKRSALIKTTKEGIFRKYIVIAPYFNDYERLLDDIERNIANKYEAYEKISRFEIYSLWRKNLSLIVAILAIIFFWIPVVPFVSLIFFKELFSSSILLAILFFSFVAIMITIAAKNSITETLRTVIIDENSLVLMPGKLFGINFGRKKVFDYASFDYYLYYRNDNLSKTLYIRFLIKNKEGKICFKIKDDVDKLDKMFELLKLNNKNLKEIQSHS